MTCSAKRPMRDTRQVKFCAFIETGHAWCRHMPTRGMGPFHIRRALTQSDTFRCMTLGSYPADKLLSPPQLRDGPSRPWYWNFPEGMMVRAARGVDTNDLNRWSNGSIVLYIQDWSPGSYAGHGASKYCDKWRILWWYKKSTLLRGNIILRNVILGILIIRFRNDSLPVVMLRWSPLC